LHCFVLNFLFYFLCVIFCFVVRKRNKFIVEVRVLAMALRLIAFAAQLVLAVAS